MVLRSYIYFMRYFLKKSTPSKKGLYLQIYRTNYVPGKGNQNKSFKALGYVSDLKEKGIDDPIRYVCLKDIHIDNVRTFGQGVRKFVQLNLYTAL